MRVLICRTEWAGPHEAEPDDPEGRQTPEGYVGWVRLTDTGKLRPRLPIGGRGDWGNFGYETADQVCAS